ncbi:MAG: histidine kinase [Bacteroidota bacterium]
MSESSSVISNKSDLIIRFVGIPIVSFFGALVFCPDGLFNNGLTYTGISLLISLVFTVVIWEGNCFILATVRKRLPGYSNTTRRIVLQSILAISYTIIAYILLKIAMIQSGVFEGIDTKYDLLIGALVCLLPTVAVSMVYESVYFFSEWKANIRQTEALAHAHLQSQFEALKKQLDPHFLFNSLNTLASLIDFQNEPAQKYLERLSDVYRYVLETRSRATVSLEEEIAFIHAYVYLLKVRFRDNLEVQLDLNPEIYTEHIPALSLQLLVENAIKHNVVSKDKPLKIRIYRDEAHINVSNNKQEKKMMVPSTKVGLQNIIERYRLLGQQGIEVLNGDEQFTVRLPLLQTAVA